MFKFAKIIILIIAIFFNCSFVIAKDDAFLSAGISITDRVPVDLMGTWRVLSKLNNTDSPANFKQSGIDLWNLSKSDNVINLCNPMTGASASVNVEYVKGNTIRFTKEGSYDNQRLTDTVEITLDGSKFTGVNYLSLKTYSNVNNSLIKEKTATYNLQGDKISGTSISER